MGEQIHPQSKKKKTPPSYTASHTSRFTLLLSTWNQQFLRKLWYLYINI